MPEVHFEPEGLHSRILVAAMVANPAAFVDDAPHGEVAGFDFNPGCRSNVMNEAAERGLLARENVLWVRLDAPPIFLTREVSPGGIRRRLVLPSAPTGCVVQTRPWQPD